MYWISCCPHAAQILPKSPASQKRLPRHVLDLNGPDRGHARFFPAALLVVVHLHQVADRKVDVGGITTNTPRLTAIMRFSQVQRECACHISPELTDHVNYTMLKGKRSSCKILCVSLHEAQELSRTVNADQCDNRYLVTLEHFGLISSTCNRTHVFKLLLFPYEHPTRLAQMFPRGTQLSSSNPGNLEVQSNVEPSGTQNLCRLLLS
jgi:hypothetical protein